MFEDLWPSYGDYDFNDFVANYKIQLHLQNKNKVMAVHIGLYINAIGGSLPYDFYLQLNNVTGGQIESIDRGECENFGGDAKMMWVDPGESDKNPAIFKFDGIRSNIHKPEGSIFLNTEKGFEIEQSKLGRISYMIYFRNAIDLDNLNFDSFNFFLGKPIAEGSNELQEIHFSGQEPSIFGRNYYNEKLTNTNMDGSKKWYSSNTNIVWAIHIPTSLYHTTEKSSFMKAYPKFEKWITTGGAEATDWYIGHENRNPEYLMK
ncbi:MAG: LruC domain-containing protein, partial [Bacteroidales bacterium]